MSVTSLKGCCWYSNKPVPEENKTILMYRQLSSAMSASSQVFGDILCVKAWKVSQKHDIEGALG